MNRWLKREMLIAGRSRVWAGVLFFWAPISLTPVLVVVLWLIYG